MLHRFVLLERSVTLKFSLIITVHFYHILTEVTASVKLFNENVQEGCIVYI